MHSFEALNTAPERSIGRKWRAFLCFVIGAAVTIVGCSSDDSNGDSSSELTYVEELVSVNDTNLFTARVGSGTPIIVLHGGLGLDHQYFRPTLDSWGEFAELIFFDHQGNGQSDVPEDYSTISFESLVNDIDAHRESLGFDKVVLMGHSYGGFLAQAYALQHQDKLDGLILASTSPNIGYAPIIPEDASEESLAALNLLFSTPFQSDESWRETWNQALPLYWPEIAGFSELSTDIDSRTTYRAAAWNRGFELLATYNVTDRLSEITVPTLIVAGRNDFITVPQAQEDMNAAIANSELVFFEESGHFPFITEPDSYRTTVRNWLAGLSD